MARGRGGKVESAEEDEDESAPTTTIASVVQLVERQVLLCIYCVRFAI